MFKRTLLSMAMIAIAFATGYATAQTYFLNQAPAPSNTAADKSSPTSDNFQSQTQQQLDKKSQAMDNQLNQELAKIPPPPPPPPPHEETPGNTAAPASAGQTPESAQVPAASTTPPKTTAPTASTPTSPDLTPSGPSPAAPPVTAPNSTQVYTGFQNSNSGPSPGPGSGSAPAANQNPPSSNSGNTGGGWDIKY